MSKSDYLKQNMLVDEADRSLIEGFTLWVNAYGYIICDKKKNGKRERISLSHLILGKPPIGYVVDHKNGNQIDNRRSNLHFATYAYNSINQRKRCDSTQEYKAIELLPSGRFSVKVTNGRRLGTFNSVEEAKKCYNEYVFSRFNMPIYVTTT